MMDYFSQARLAWTFDGRIASAAIGERAILAVRLPEADRVAKADALRAAGEWNPRWDATYQAIKGFRVYVVEDRERKLLGLGESWEDASVIAEEYAEENADGVLAKRQNGWRGQEASEKQERLLRRWNLWRDGMSKGAAAQAITHKMAMEALRG